MSRTIEHLRNAAEQLHRFGRMGEPAAREIEVLAAKLSAFQAIDATPVRTAAGAFDVVRGSEAQVMGKIIACPDEPQELATPGTKGTGREMR